uniref:uncharacterized protein LOC120329926 n=1 Tax=Styela clava TaxID=7725 RepID=UPI00193931D1|nr:uncharacterized protein LOC120329926 [Styela clava]
MNLSTNISGNVEESLVLNVSSSALWAASVSFSTGYFVVTTYIMVMLIIDMCVNEVGVSRNESIGKKIGGWIKISRLIFVAICNISYLTGCLGRVLVEIYYTKFCHLYYTLRIMSESGAATSSYFTIWLRHRIIHSIPAMKHATNYATRIISAVVLVLVLVLPASSGLLFVLNFSTKFTQYGCVVAGPRDPNLMSMMVFNLSSIALQVMILGLFLHPLRQHQKNIGTAADNLTPMLRRAFFAALVCCVSDTAASISVVFGIPFIKNLAMETTYFINILMILICFPEWKTTLFPFISFTSEEN